MQGKGLGCVLGRGSIATGPTAILSTAPRPVIGTNMSLLLFSFFFFFNMQDFKIRWSKW